MVRSWRTVKAHFFHVPREYNVVADWMSKVARLLEADPDLAVEGSCHKDGKWVVAPPLGLEGPGIVGGVLEKDLSGTDLALAVWESQPPGS